MSAQRNPTHGDRERPDRRAPGFLYRCARAAFRFATSGAYRASIILRWRKPKNLFQLSAVTWADRYPEIFEFARRELGGGKDVKLLSFGCSTGEEVFTLRRYFPLATIRGLDINPHSIATCRSKLRARPDPGLTFEVASSLAGEASESWDAIFCMAIFRDGALADPGVARCDRRIRFAGFSAMIGDVARCLRPGGLLFLAHANFRFRDTPAARDFDLVLRARFGSGGAGITPIFDRDNTRTAEFDCDEAGFRKKAAPGANSPR